MKFRTGLMVLVLSVACQGPENGEQTRVSTGPNGQVLLSHGDLQLSLDAKLGLTVSLAGRSIVEPPGEYLNLYDIIYDQPEAHAIRKDGVMYYGFYAESWNGPLELRGLEAHGYQVIDYVENRELGTVTGPLGRLEAAFDHYLLVKCIPQ